MRSLAPYVSVLAALGGSLAPLVACRATVAPDACRGSACTAASGFDVIVVGSGAGGGPLAARLARAGKRVLLLEAGDDVGGTPAYDVPAMHALSTEDPALAWWYFVRHHADPALDRADSKWTKDGILYPRGSALGGSTAVNAMVTVLPSPSDWDRLAALTGDPSWRAAQMARYEDRVREWLSVEIPSPSLALGDRRVSSFLSAAAAAFADGAGDGGASDPAAVGSSLTTLLQADLNARLRDGETTGIYRLPLATSHGRRAGARDAVLATVAAGFPLTVRTGAFVTRVLWDERAAVPTAVGVELVSQRAVYAAHLAQEPPGDARERIFARQEVVLSAGAFNSPQLLQLSGVGDPNALGALGIDTRVARPAVGTNLQDRYEAAVVTTFAAPLDIVAPCKLGEGSGDDPCMDEWNAGGGVYQTPGFLASVLMRSSSAVPLADLQVFAVPTDARGYYPGYSKDSARAKNSFTWLLLKAHTQNRDGTVTLADASPFSRPDIVFRSYDETKGLADPDLLALVQGIKFVRRIEDRMRALVPDDPAREVWPGYAQSTDAQLAAWIQRESWGHHACCTDPMGRADDPAAVLDARFRVLGAQHLRVVDASVFPEIPGTFLAMPTYMIAEKAADAILEDDR